MKVERKCWVAHQWLKGGGVVEWEFYCTENVLLNWIKSVMQKGKTDEIRYVEEV